MERFYNNSIFWVEVEKIRPNPFQPRKEFNEGKLEELADSIRQYGILQPLVVTRHEIEKEDGGLAIEYELIVGERRLRSARIAGLPQVPVIIRTSDETDNMKLELAIVENLQREDLNPIDRARAFRQLVDKFNLKHAEVGKKIGRSREYVSNTLRLLTMPEEVQQALLDGKISEGHARPILMLTGREEEQHTLFKEILYKRLTVREAEEIARRIAQDRVRKKKYAIDPELIELEKQLTETLGTRVQIEQREEGGKIHIDYFTVEDLHSILERIEGEIKREKVKEVKISEASSSLELEGGVLDKSDQPETNLVKKEGGFIEKFISFTIPSVGKIASRGDELKSLETTSSSAGGEIDIEAEGDQLDDRSPKEIEEEENDEDLYSIKNFSV